MYQQYWLAYNDAGCGNSPVREGETVEPGVTINTLRVGGPNLPPERLESFASEFPIGVDYDAIRLRLARRYDSALFRLRKWVQLSAYRVRERWSSAGRARG
jgi:hypothetical protein